MTSLDRRRFLVRAAAGGSALLLAGCDKLSETPWVRAVLGGATDVTKTAQRAILPRSQLARTYPKSAISKEFRANGSTDPDNPDYKKLAANHFTDWKLEIGGLVEHPQTLSLAALRAMPAQTQITRHDCVEGWSCIGGWTGVPLGEVLGRVGLRPGARYVVFRCADSLDGAPYYESIDLVDAFHPQTILAYAMNGRPLTVPHGAPLRLRVERQLGYKMAKYLVGLDVVAGFGTIGAGNGGYWEDRGYEWYAGI